MGIRFDKAIKIGKTQITPQGYLRIESVPVSRADCVLTYTEFNGKTRREYRPKEEVFNQESMDTLKSAPITIGHTKMITSADSSLVKGHSAENVRADGDKVVVDLVVTDSQTIKDVQSTKLKYISPGYSCDPVEKSDPRFDYIQTNVIYNHIGLLEKVGRQGSDLSIRLDSDDNETIENTEKGVKETMKVKVRLDSIEHEIDVTDAAQAQVLVQYAARLDSSQKTIDTLNGQIAAKDQLIAAEKERTDTAMSDAVIESRIAERMDAIDALLSINPEIKRETLKGKSIKDIRLDSLEAAGLQREDFADGTDDFIRGACIGLRAPTKIATDGISNAPRDLKNKEVSRLDTSDDPETAKKEMEARTRNRYKTNNRKEV
jgi:hypothetical protein